MMAALDGAIEVGAISLGGDGNAVATVTEKAPSTSSVQKKSAKLIFVRAGDKWEWDQFEDNRRFYPVDKLFPYTKEQIEKQRQMASARWAVFLDNMAKPGDTAVRALETA